jgi:hypothetical protein
LELQIADFRLRNKSKKKHANQKFSNPKAKQWNSVTTLCNSVVNKMLGV